MSAPLRTAVSVAAEITAILDRLTPDTRRGAEILLEGLGFTEEDYDGPLTDWADAKYEALSASEREDGGWRYFADEPYGHRLPRTRSLGRLLVACIAVALLAGCDASRTRLNPGADLAAYEADPAWFYENLPRQYGVRIWGFYDPEDGSVTVDRTMTPWGKARVFNHEVMGHAYDHQKPRDGWELMARYHSDAFPLLTHSQEQIDLGRELMATYPDPVEVQRAIDAAREAATAEAKP